MNNNGPEKTVNHNQDPDVTHLADDLLIDAMLKGRYRDTPETTARRVARAVRTLEAAPKVITMYWKAGLSTAAAAILVIGLTLVFTAPQNVKANLTPILATFDIGDKTYQIDISVDPNQPDFPRGFNRQRFNRSTNFRPPRYKMSVRRLDGALLYTRSRKYVLKCRRSRGETITKGFDGVLSWLVTPRMQTVFGQDHSLLQKDVPEHISSLLFLNLRETLHKIQKQYDVSGPSRGTAEEVQLQLDYYVAKRIESDDRIPQSIELWVNTQTGQLYQILCSGVKFHSRQKSLYTLQIVLLSTDPLPVNWFTQAAHMPSSSSPSIELNHN